MKLEEHVLESSSGEYSRKAWILKGTTSGPQKLCLFLDAEFYLNRMDTPALLLDLQADGSIPPVTCLFISHVEGAARHVDYTCNPRYAQFVAEDAVRWVKGKCDGISERDNLICGLSLSGLEAAYLGLTRPDLFSATLCQSASFWWNNEWLSNSARSLSSEPGRFWISVGDQERSSGISHPPTGMRQDVTQVDATERMVAELNRMGCSINFHLFDGGHDPVAWKRELPAALQWLIGKA